MRGHMIGMEGWASSNGDANEFLQKTNVFDIGLGILIAILSAVANGSFTVFSKLDSVKQANVDPLVFNFWACIGIVLSSALVCIKSHLLWTPLGLISGLCFVLSAANSYRSVRIIGVSVGTGIWSGTAVVVSFGAGILLDPDGGVRTLLWAGIGIAVLIVGVGGVTYSGHVGRKASGQEEDLSALLNSESEGQSKVSNFSSGVLSAVLAGILGGLIMIPLTWADESVQGVNYLPSFGVGVLVFAPIVTFFAYVTTTQEWPEFKIASAALPGIVSGIVWNIGNLLSIIAIGYISYSAAYPIMQTGIFVAGIWGMFLFNEIQGGAAISYWISGVILIAGIVILTWAH